VWSIDAAQLPALVATPILAAFALQGSYPWVFVACYVLSVLCAVAAIALFHGVDIWRYARRGVIVFGVALTPVAVVGIAMNLAAAATAALLGH
jgi:hypothetical protein